MCIASLLLPALTAVGPTLPAPSPAVPSPVVPSPAARVNDVDPLVATHYLKSSNTAIGQRFGSAVAVSGDTAVVGAPDDQSEGAHGRAYVFVKSGGAWFEQQVLSSAAPDAFDQFGATVAVWGNTIAIGVPGEDSEATGVNGDPTSNGRSASGAVFVYTRTKGTWSLDAYLKAEVSNQFDQFGSAVALFEDTLVVGAPRESGSDSGVGGDVADNTAPGSGAAYVFERDVLGDWKQRAYLKAVEPGYFDGFGTSVAVWGERVLVGAPEEDSNPAGAFPNEGFTGSGAAYAFERTASGWTTDGYLKAPSSDPLDHFGTAVALWNGVAVVGAPDEDGAFGGVNGNADNDTVFSAGAAYVFEREGAGWLPRAYLKASTTTFGANFGSSVAIHQDVVAVGAPSDRNCVNQGGAAYVFRRADAGWSPIDTAFGLDCIFGDDFGRAVALGFDDLLVGAPGENSAATGVGGDPTNTSASDAGAVTAFALDLDLRRISGCGVASARWVLPTAAVRVGSSLPLVLDVDGVPTGVGITFIGVRAFDLAGCGFEAGASGEVLLALQLSPSLLKTSPIAGGAIDDAVAVPAAPGLVGVRLTLQALLIGTAGALELSDGFEFAIRP